MRVSCGIGICVVHCSKTLHAVTNATELLFDCYCLRQMPATQDKSIKSLYKCVLTHPMTYTNVCWQQVTPLTQPHDKYRRQSKDMV